MSKDQAIVSGWKEVSLAETGDYINGYAFKPEDWDGAGLPIIRIQNLTDPDKAFNRTSLTINERCRVLPGDMLVSWSATLDAFVWRGEEAWLNQHIFKVVPNRELVTEKFLHYLLKNAIAELVKSEHLHGSTMRHINRKPFLAHKVSVPIQKEKQEDIAEKIEELFSDLDVGVAALKRAQANLKRYRAAVLKAAVEGRLTEQWRAERKAKGIETEPAAKLLAHILAERRKKWDASQLKKYADADKTPPKGWQNKYPEPAAPDTSGLPELPEDWCWTRVAQTAEIQSGLQKQPSRTPKNNAYPYLRVANVLRGRLNLTEIHRFELFQGELERLRLEAGDILIVEGNGSPSEIGRCAIWNGEIDNCIHQNHIIRVRPVITNSRFVDFYWNSPNGSARVKQKAASTSGLYTLSVSKIAGLPLPLPPLDEQIEIVAQVEAKLSNIAQAETEIRRSLERAARLRQAILKRAFEGRLV